MIFSSIVNVNIFPAIPVQIRKPSAACSAIAPFTVWEKIVVVISGIFSAIYDVDKGLLNSLLNLFGRQGILWKLEENQLTVRGRLQGGTFDVPGNISSQFITGLCFALPLLEEDSHIRFTTPLESYSYIRMTMDTLKAFGITVSREENGLSIPGRQVYRPTEYAIEGDWSYGAFWIVGGAVNGDVTIDHLHSNTLQGDAKAADILESMGADIQRTPTSLRVRKSSLKGTMIDLADVPDLAPVLAVAACAAQGKTEFIHAGRLKIKESDRLKAIEDMVKTLGGRIETTEDSFVIEGTGKLDRGVVETRNDHRMAMAAAIAAGIAGGDIHLDDRDCVAKSAPQFWEHFAKLGGISHE